MNQPKHSDIESIDYFYCMGEFNMNSIICRQRCCLNLRCIIEQNRSTQTDLMEELMTSSVSLLRVQ